MNIRYLAPMGKLNILLVYASKNEDFNPDFILSVYNQVAKGKGISVKQLAILDKLIDGFGVVETMQGEVVPENPSLDEIIENMMKNPSLNRKKRSEFFSTLDGSEYFTDFLISIDPERKR